MPATPGIAAASTAPSATPSKDDDRPRAASSGPGADGFRALAAKHRLVPVWRELVADTITPVAAFLGIVGDHGGPGFLFESVEGGERWGRYSFVGRRPLATMTSAGGQITTVGPLDLDAATGGRVSGRTGMLAALEAVLDAFDSPELPELPPLHAGLVGYLGYDVVREVEHLPDVPPDDLGHPDAVLSVIGQLAAFDHWRQRVVLIDNVVVDPDGTTRRRCDAAYQPGRGPARRSWPPTASAPTGESARPLPEPSGLPDDVVRTMSDRLYEDAVRAAKEHITAGDVFQVVLSQRFDLDPRRRPLRRLPGAAPGQPEPLPVLPAIRRASRWSGASPEPMVRLRDGTVISRPIAGSRPRGVDAGGATPASRGSSSRTRRRWPST